LWVVAFAVNFDATGKGADRAPATGGPDEPLAAVDAEQVQSIEISDSENKVRIARADGQWVLPDKFGAPAMSTRAADLLKALQGLERAERVAKSAGATKSQVYGVDPSAAKRLRVLGLNDKVIADLWVGKPDMGGERSVQLSGNFVRPDGSDAVYSHKNRLQHLVMPQLSMWLEGRLFPLEPKDIEDTLGKAEQVTVEFDDVPMTPGTPESRAADPSAPPPPRVRVVLTGREPESQPAATESPVGPTPATPPRPQRVQREWALKEPVDADVKPYAPFVDQIVRGLMYGRADDVVGSDPNLAEYGFAKPFVEVELRFSDGVTRRMRVGNQAPPPSDPARKTGTFRFAHVDGVPRVFLINEYALTAYRKKPADLKQPDIGRGAIPGVAAPIELPKDGAESRKQ
jgi:hypothetical protein